MAKILIVEDEGLIAADLKAILEDIGHEVIGAVNNGISAVNLVKKKMPDIILMDINLKGNLDGIETAKMIQDDNDIPVIYLTAYADQSKLLLAKDTWHFGFISKPFDIRTLGLAVESGLKKCESR